MFVSYIYKDVTGRPCSRRSLTWTDAHLHRQLITVLRGPVVEAFDREFRILFAASLPVADTLRAAGSHEDVKRRLKDLSELRLQKRLPAESEMISPPSPPPDSHLDWEAMGVVQRESIPESPLRSHDETVLKETPLTLWFDDNNPPHNNMHHLLDRNMYLSFSQISSFYSAVFEVVCT